jgi:putative FmdB family regulatory protein
MPFYEYECQACKFYTEVMQKITDAPLARCPSCGKRALKKLLSAPVFRLKGAGWYETDFKSAQENKRNLVGAEKEEPKSDVKAPTDGKPAAQEAKDSKPADAKPAESKAAAPKTAVPGGAAPARNRVSVAGKSARAAATRKPTRASKPRGARRRRR